MPLWPPYDVALLDSELSTPPRGVWASAGVPDGLQLGERSNSFQTQDSSLDFSSSAGKIVNWWEQGKYRFSFDEVATRMPSPGVK